MLDHSAYPHLFDFVLDYLYDANDIASLQVVASTSVEARQIVLDKLAQHMVVDCLAGRIGTFHRGGWREEWTRGCQKTRIIDVVGNENLKPSQATFISGCTPSVLRIKDTAYVPESDVPTAIHQLKPILKGWNLDEESIIVLPPQAKRNIIYIPFDPIFGLQETYLYPLHKGPAERAQELVVVICPEAGACDEFGNDTHQGYPLEVLLICVLEHLHRHSRSTFTLVGKERFRTAWFDTSERSVPPAEGLRVGATHAEMIKHHWDWGFRENGLYGSMDVPALSEQEVAAYASGAELLTVNEYRTRVGDWIWDLIFK